MKVNFVGETQLTVTQLASIYVVWEFSKVIILGVESLLPFLAFVKTQLSHTTLMTAVNDRKCVFHFRPKPNIWPEKHLALGRIPKPKPNVQI